MIWVKQLDNEDNGIELYIQVVWHVSLKRKIRPVYLRDQRNPAKPAYTPYSRSTLNQSAQEEILKFYRLRFQIEFIFQDAKKILDYPIVNPELKKYWTFILMLVQRHD